jgi:hypothetical protein
MEDSSVQLRISCPKPEMKFRINVISYVKFTLKVLGKLAQRQRSRYLAAARPENRLSCAQYLRPNFGVVSQLHHECSNPNRFYYFIHQSPYYRTLQV